MFPTATVRLYTSNKNVEAVLMRMTANMPGGGLSVTVVLDNAITEMRCRFMDGRRQDEQSWRALGRVDLRRTSLRRIGSHFLCGCDYLTTVNLPPSLTEVGHWYQAGCHRLQSVDMGHTALHAAGEWFASNCSRLTTVVLPDTVTKVGSRFLYGSGRVEVTSGSTAVQAAAAELNAADQQSDIPSLSTLLAR